MIETMEEAMAIAKAYCADRHLPNQHTYQIAINDVATWGSAKEHGDMTEGIPFTTLVLERKTLQWHMQTMDIMQNILPEIVVPLPEDFVSILSVTLCEKDDVWTGNKGSALHTRLMEVEFGVGSRGVESFSIKDDQLILNLAASHPRMSLKIEYFAVSPSCVTPPRPCGRRAAVMATRAKKCHPNKSAPKA